MADLLDLAVSAGPAHPFVPSAAHDIPALRAEVARLSVAKYVIAPKECGSERDCDEYWDADGGAADIEWCSHVEHAVATGDDAIRLDRVRHYLRDVDPETASVEDVRHAVDMAKRSAFNELND